MRFLFLRAGLLMFALGFTGLKDPYLLACVADCVAGVRRGRGRALSPPKRLQLGIDENSNYFSFSQPPCDTKRPLRRREDRGGGGTAGAIQLGLREYKSSSDHLYLTALAKKYRVFCMGENWEHIDCEVCSFLLHSIHTTLPLATSWLCLSSLKIESKVSWK